MPSVIDMVDPTQQETLLGIETQELKLINSGYGKQLAKLLWDQPNISVEDALAQMMGQGILRCEIPTRVITQAMRERIFHAVAYRKALHMAITDEESGQPDPWKTVRVIMNHRASKQSFRSQGRAKQRDRLNAIHERNYERRVARETGLL
jgi:hypothetical protein